MSNRKSSRRRFLSSSGASIAIAGLTARGAQTTRVVNGANDRISIGIVGAGQRGTELMAWVNRIAETQNVEITAVCDIWKKARQAGVDRVSGWTDRKPMACRNIRELCEQKEVDAVIIATPDFQHPVHARIAVEAGKHAYVEKPFGCDFDQIKAARSAVKASKKIVQMGTFRRSHSVPWSARDFMRRGGLGRVSYVEMIQPLFQQRWRIPGSEDMLTEQDTDWDEFLTYTPKVPFDARKYLEFRLFWPYSTGIFCQWMSHAVDLVNLVLDETPKAVTAAGGVYVWQDGRTNPDTASCLVEYPSGCLFSYHMRLGNSEGNRSLLFYGTTGTMDLYAGVAYGEGGGGDIARIDPDDAGSLYDADASTRLPDRVKGGVILNGRNDEDHMANFVRAMRNGRQPSADVDSGFAHALASTMAGLSLRTGRRIEYDPETDSISAKEPGARTPNADNDRG